MPIRTDIRHRLTRIVLASAYALPVLLSICLAAPAPSSAQDASSAVIAATDVNALLAIARESLISGQYSNSLIASNKALRLSNNGNPDAYLLRAMAEFYLGSYSQARSDARRAGELYRNSTLCDQYLLNNTLQDALGTTNNYYYDDGLISSPLYSALFLGSSYLYPGTTTATSTNGTTTGTTGTTTGTTGTTTTQSSLSTGTTGTTATNGTTGTTGTTSSSSSGTISAMGSSGSSIKLPVSENLDQKEAAEDAAQQQQNQMIAQTILPLATCTAMQKGNKNKIVPSWLEQGLANLRTAQFTAADATFSQALSLDAQNVVGQAGLGLAYAGQAGSTLALSQLNQTVAQSPGSDFALTARGIYWLQTLNYQNALNDLNQALSIAPNNADIVGDISLTYYAQWKIQTGTASTSNPGNQVLLQNALTQATKAINLSPEYAGLYTLRAAIESDMAATTSDTGLQSSLNTDAANDRSKAASLQAVAGNAVINSTTLPTTTTTTTTTGQTTTTVSPTIGFAPVQTALGSQWPFFLSLPLSYAPL